MITCALGTDHHGQKICSALMSYTSTTTGIDLAWHHVGCYANCGCDYPLYVPLVVDLLRTKQVQYGVLLCGTGVGMSIAANRFSGIYAALVHTVELARLAREHDNANILVLPADYIDERQAIAMVDAWLGASFAGGRHARRLAQIDELGSL